MLGLTLPAGTPAPLVHLARRLFMLRQSTLRTERVGDVEVAFRQASFQDYMEINRVVGERTILTDLLDALADDDVFWDVGANLGAYAIAAKLSRPAVDVVPFEPVPATAARLERNLRLNDCAVAPRVLALSDRCGDATVDRPSSHGQHSLEGSGDDAVTVRTAAGDELVASGRTPAPTVAKIDVEGHERRVLEGLSRTLAEEPPRLLYCEVHGSDDVGSLLAEFGYEVERLALRRDQAMLKATI